MSKANGFKVSILRDPFSEGVLDAVRCLREGTKTIRNDQFLGHLLHDAQYSFSEGRPMYIGIGYLRGMPASIATVKSQNAKPGVRSRYASLTYVFTAWGLRGRGITTQLCREVLDVTQAERVKAVCASRGGLYLQNSLGHKFWGLSPAGKAVVNECLFGEPLKGVPQYVKTLKEPRRVSLEGILPEFQRTNWCNYMYRDDPEEYLLNGGSDGEHSYVHCGQEEVLGLQAQVAGELLRWENRKGTYVKKPGKLGKMLCFKDTTLQFPWYYVGVVRGELAYRVTVSMVGERRPATVWL